MKLSTWFWVTLIVGPRTAWRMALVFYGAAALVAAGLAAWVLWQIAGSLLVVTRGLVTALSQ